MAIPFFWKIQHLAGLGDRMSAHLGQWLWRCLKEDSEVYDWFLMLPSEDQEYMHQDQVNFLTGLKDDFLGDQWQQAMNEVFESQRFCQRGHETESPRVFITYRAMYTRMLTQANDGGALEVTIIMRKAPIAWRPILNLSMVTSMKDLLACSIEHGKALIQAHKMDRANLSTINTGDLVTALRNLGISVGKPKFVPRTARLAAADKSLEETEEPEIEIEMLLPEGEAKGEEEVFTSIYQEAKKKQRSLPKEVCGSPKHWDRECPHFEAYQERWKKNVKLVEGADTGRAYEMAYEAVQQGFEQAADSSSEDELQKEDNRRKPYSMNGAMVEVEDEEVAFWRDRVPARNFILEEAEEGEQRQYSAASEASRAHEVHMVAPNWVLNENESSPDEDTVPRKSPEEEKTRSKEVYHSQQPPLAFQKPVRVPKSQVTKDRRSAVGISVLSVKGWIGHPGNVMVDLRVDSCTNITLMSEDYYQSMTHAPPLRQGPKMSLYQLTQGDTKLKGYVQTSIFIKAKNGELVETDVEAYVVFGMNVPILLGEDYQMNYERPELTIQASPVQPLKDSPRLMANVSQKQSFVKAKDHHRRKNKHRQFRIPSKVVRVEGDFKDGDEWFIERSILPQTKESFLIIPNVLVQSSDPCAPISNTSSESLTLKAGEILSTRVLVREYFDTPADNERRSGLECTANLVRIMAESFPAEARMDEEVDMYGPKTAAMPDTEVLPSSKI
ncbi:hypothetical protein EV421DRAFT_1913704 [Armillaria borealis]|uniref:Uncharacterized protein n=1 Tax=Armillaria borealis TaxID=47425 RepID=A0AA39IUE4_9AGAR|nr:hypothetical protein EV421DRAFT_1913704 [Armillaria borealis]